MLKVTFLACGLIISSIMVRDAKAAERVDMPPDPPAPLSWTGRFMPPDETSTDWASHKDGLTKMPPAMAPSTPDFGDPDIVGSIPPTPQADAYTARVLANGSQSGGLCGVPLLGEKDKETWNLACEGIRNNPWSRKVENFNYDLGSFDQSWMEDFYPYKQNPNSH